MFVVKRSHHNPLLLPLKENLWESIATFNWCPIQEKNPRAKNVELHCVYRAMGTPENINNGPSDLSTIGYTSSKDGLHFNDRRQLIAPQFDWEKYGCEDPRVTYFEGKYYIFYTALSTYPFGPQGIKVAVAITDDFKTIKEKHLVTPFNAKAMTLFPERINGKIAVILSVNTDTPPAKMAFAFFDNIEDLWNEEAWALWYKDLDHHTVDIRRFPSDHIEVGAPPVKTERGWLFVYSHIQHYFDNQTQKVFGIEALLLDLKNPEIIIGRTKGPLIVPEEIYEQYGFVPKVTFPSGAIIRGVGSKATLDIYYGAADTTCARASVNLSDLLESIIPETGDGYVTRVENNPVLLADPSHDWESKAVFNPTAIELGNTIYILYRAMSSDNTSTVGLALSKDGLHISERLKEPIYVPREAFESKRVPGGNSGCEDPRIVKIGSRLYMTYTAYNGVNMPSVAVSSISVKDFLARKWNWSKPALISPTEVDDKDSCIFPVPINKKYMIMHRVGINICADFVKTLDFTEEKITKCIEIMKPRAGMWDGRKVGIAAPPLKTKKGWLLLYHGISERGYYRVGAALLDLKNPNEIIARTTDALMSPETNYEINGQVSHVVFPCGLINRGDTLYIYYGGADSVVGIAIMKLSKLLRALTE